MITESLRLHSCVRPRAPWLTVLERQSLTTIDFGTAWERTLQRARTLTTLGVEESSRVGIAPRNDLDSIITLLAILKLGAHAWLIDPEQPSDRLKRQISARRPDILIGDLAGATQIIPDTNPEGPDTQVSISADSPAFLFSTSGSTGLPKAVIQSHRSIIANAQAFSSHHRLGPGRTILGFLPIFHVNAMHSNVIASLYAGSHCVLLRPDSLVQLHRRIEQLKPYMVSLVPSAADVLLRMWRKPQVPNNLHHILSAAAPLSTQTATNFNSKFNRRIIQGYGLSETVNFSTTVPINLDPSTYETVINGATTPSVGTVLSGVAIDIRDDKGDLVSEGEVGQLYIRGDHLMSGYDNDPDATASVLSNGQFASGDLGYFRVLEDSRQYFYLTGRLHNAVKVNGQQISLEEVEYALRAIPGIVDAGCGLRSYPEGGRIIAAIVTTSSFRPDTVSSLLSHVLPPHGIPAEYLQVQNVSRTPTGKIRRQELARLFKE